jgi:hypothetical protein
MFSLWSLNMLLKKYFLIAVVTMLSFEVVEYSFDFDQSSCLLEDINDSGRGTQCMSK